MCRSRILLFVLNSEQNSAVLFKFCIEFCIMIVERIRYMRRWRILLFLLNSEMLCLDFGQNSADRFEFLAEFCFHAVVSRIPG